MVEALCSCATSDVFCCEIRVIDWSAFTFNETCPVWGKDRRSAKTHTTCYCSHYKAEAHVSMAAASMRVGGLRNCGGISAYMHSQCVTDASAFV